ncbi:heparan-alpha-glucosaminide N-acetyltransferase like protein [Danaus plexippus plexippus]|uniref:Heparan-alpha-glucosaminide N-acetyltransferase like protein n=1 Tax=Danaus plexippus plexippus TaxID=278856 RepID=A0A212EY16_DANPL|nr:heparan-alpha-glucosaminide N-acetyltransferase like protein [Danaus plexippus plexippus]
MNESVSEDTWLWVRGVLRSWLEDPGVEEFRGLNMSELQMDQAYMMGIADGDVGVYSVSDDCFRCPFELQKSLDPSSNSSWIVSTAKRSTWRVYSGADEQFITARNTTGLLCQMRPNLGEFGVYTLNATSEGCDIRTEKEPVDIYMRK